VRRILRVSPVKRGGFFARRRPLETHLRIVAPLAFTAGLALLQSHAVLSAAPTVYDLIEYAPGVEVPVKPFWGVIAVAPEPSRGRVGSGPPDVFGGNLDNRDLGAGSTLYLPVQTKGGLVSIGDGHAVQGEGEVCLSAVETSLKGEVQIILHKGMKLTAPRAENATHYMAFGLDPDLNKAMQMAIRETNTFLGERYAEE
jgi:acetamidase/formamidase